MKRILSSMSVIITAVFVLGAFATAVAQAEGAGTFTWATGTVKIHAESEGHQTLVTTPGTFTCNSGTWHAAVAGTSSTDITTTSVTYNNSGSADTCPGPFGTNPKFEMNGCQWTLTAGTTLNGMETTGTKHLICPGSNKIKFNAPGCTIEIGSQNNIEGHTIYRTITTGGINHVTSETTLTGIDYNHFGILCGTASRTNGTYTGLWTIKAFNASGVQTSLEVH